MRTKGPPLVVPLISASEFLGVLGLVLFVQPHWILLIVHDLGDGEVASS